MIQPVTIRAYCLVVLLLFSPLLAAAAEQKEEAATRAALAWLALVDATQYGASWEEAAALLKNQVTTADWVKAVAAARKPMGDLVTRKLSSATYATSLPGAPDGEYVVLQFETRFKGKAQAVETVTPMMDGGRWRVAGYYVR
ncbi:MAG: DUF4019 domain-containing protein [Gammaproteobacteria bacterium]|nr:DUF4019 domain-containing protein [Gammaproteobacteria bacterium]